MENLNPLFFEYFIEAPLFEKQLVAWAMIQDKRINENTAKKLLSFINFYLSGAEADQFLKEWKRNQKLEYAFTGCGMEWEESIRELKVYFARLDGTLLVDCVYHFVRDNDIFSEYPSIQDEIQRHF
jgi:hypothetical protein